MKIKSILLDKSLFCYFPTLSISLLLYVFAIFFIFFSSVMMIYSVNAVNTVTLGLKNNAQDKKVAFVEPTFTYAAYRNGSFYNFYMLYSPLVYEKNNAIITSDLYLLKDRPIPHGPFPYFQHPEYLDIPYKNYFDVLQQHVKNYSALVTNITDVDVHEGKIFQTNGKNAYDVLFLFHNEYLTQSEYNNLKQFVINGGTIVFTD